MRVLGNVLWHVPGLGFVSAVLSYIFGLIMVATVIGAPIGLGLFALGSFLLAPFTRSLVLRSDLEGDVESKAWKTWSAIVIPLYLPLGLVLFILNIFTMLLVIITAGISIIGIILLVPYLYAFGNSLTTILNPVGMTCVDHVVAEKLKEKKAKKLLKQTKKEHKKRKK